MNQQMFVIIFASSISTYFGVLILMYILRTLIACVFDHPNSQGFSPASTSKVEAEISTTIAIQTGLLTD